MIALVSLIVLVVTVNIASAASGVPLLNPLWTASLPSTVVPPSGVNLGWSLFVDAKVPSNVSGAGFFVTTTVNHTLCVLDSSNQGTLLWSYSSWTDHVTPSDAYSRSIVSGVTPSNVQVLLVLRGSYLYVFDLIRGTLLAEKNTLLYGEVPSSIEAITPSLMLLQYYSWVAVVEVGSGAVQWTAPVISGVDIRTGMNTAPYVAVAQNISGSEAGSLAVSVLAAASGDVVFRATYHSSSMEFLYLMVVESSSVTVLLQQQGIANGAQQVCRFHFNGTEVFCIDVVPTIWGYGIVNDVMYLQLTDGSGISITVYNYSTGAPVSNTGLLPLTTAGQGHLVGEPEYALLAFVVNQSQFHLTGWAHSGGNLFNFTFMNSGATSHHAARMVRTPGASTVGRLRDTLGHGNHPLQYSADANIMMANWNGQVFVPDISGFHYVDGNRAALDDRYASAFPDGLVFPASALTEKVLVVTSGATVSAYEIL